MFYTLSIQSKKQIKKDMDLGSNLSQLEINCCDSQFFEIILESITN